MTTRRWVRVVRASLLAGVSVGLLTLGGRTARAQGPSDAARPERPNLALFGGGLGDVEQSLTFSGLVGLTGDTFSAKASEGSEAGPAIPPGIHSAGDWGGSLAYTSAVRRLRFQGTGGLSGRHLFRAGNPTLISRNGAASAQYDAGRSTTLTATAAILDQPVSFSSLLPGSAGNAGGFGAVLPVDYAPGVDVARTTTQDVRLQVARAFGRRTSVSGGYNYRRVVLSDVDFGRATQSLFAGLSQGLTRNLSLRLGYGRGLSRATVSAADGTVREYSNQTFDIGLDFARPWSISRRTQLDVRTGGTGLSDGIRTRYALTGAATLSHEIGRTGRLAATFSRQADFLETLRAPAIADTAVLAWSMLLSRRVNVDSTAVATFATIGLGPESSDFRTYAGRAGMTVGLTRFLGMRFEYSYDRYRFDDVGVIPVAFVNDLARHSLRASVNVWAPVFYRRGRLNATR